MSSQMKPNIVVIWAPDIETAELGCYARASGAGAASSGVNPSSFTPKSGVGPTPNIDRIAREGMLFSNTAPEPGESAAVEFMSGQSSAPGTLCRAGDMVATAGSRRPDATLASLLRARGYVTGQFGGLRPSAVEDCLICLDSFDELVGWPRTARSQASAAVGCGSPDAARDAEGRNEGPWWARFGRRRDEPPLPALDSAELSDEELVALARLFMRRQHARGLPFFAWIRVTHTHLVARRSAGAAVRSSRARSIAAHDRNVGELLEQLDLLGLADDTFIVYCAEEAHADEPRDAADAAPTLPSEASAPARGRPLIVRWPGRIPAAAHCNGVVHWRDWLPTLLAVAGDPRRRERSTPFSSAALRASEASITGTNVLPYLMAETRARAAPGLTYFDDDGGLLTFRYDNWDVQRRERHTPLPRRPPPPRSHRVTPRDGVAAPAVAPAAPAASREAPAVAPTASVVDPTAPAVALAAQPVPRTAPPVSRAAPPVPRAAPRRRPSRPTPHRAGAR